MCNMMHHHHHHHHHIVDGNVYFIGMLQNLMFCYHYYFKSIHRSIFSSLDLIDRSIVSNEEKIHSFQFGVFFAPFNLFVFFFAGNSFSLFFFFWLCYIVTIELTDLDRERSNQSIRSMMVALAGFD